MPYRDRPLAYCADVGSIREGRFGWARGGATGELQTGTDIRELARSVSSDLRDGLWVALGFECPLYVPFRTSPGELTRARTGEGNRPWSAGAGSGVLATGLVQVLWVLEAVRDALDTAPPVHLNWDEVNPERGPGLFLWEALVSGSAKSVADDSESHTEDAAIAVRSFRDALPDPTQANAVEAERVQSLIGAALLRTGWSEDPEILQIPCLVIRP